MSVNIGYSSYINPNHTIGDYGVTIKGTNTSPDINIGRYCSIGKNCYFAFTHHDYNYVSTCPKFSPSFSRGHISIGNDVWIGANVTIMDNVIIGDGAVIGTNCIVTKNVPPYAIVVGNPGRIVKYRFSHELIEELLKIKWWEFGDEDLNKLNIKTENINEFIERVKEYRKS